MPMNHSGTQLIVFAWIVDVVGVNFGVINSTYTTFGDDLPTTLSGYVPAVPMVMLAVAELGRVPLASVLFQRRMIVRGLAFLGIIGLGYLAAENWTFGFERIVDLRLKPVNNASRELTRDEAEKASLEYAYKNATGRDANKREELRRGVAERESSISRLTAQLEKAAEIHQANLTAIREACRLIRGECIRPRSNEEDRRYQHEVEDINGQLHGLRTENKALQSQIDGLITLDTNAIASLDQKLRLAEAAVDEKRQQWLNAIDRNQIYRLAASWYGVATSDASVSWAKLRCRTRKGLPSYRDGRSSPAWSDCG
jgi:hypothetical protein